MATAKKGNLFRLRLHRVPKGVEVSVLTEPALYKSFQEDITSRHRGVECSLHTVGTPQTYIYIPRSARQLLELDANLTAFIFQEDPTTVVCPVTRTKEQLVSFAQAARDFLAKWYESRLQPLSVEMSVAVTLAEPVDSASPPLPPLDVSGLTSAPRKVTR